MDSDKYLNKQEQSYLQKQVKEFSRNATKIRSRVKYFEEGEKSTKFFLNTEKSDKR